MSMIYCDGCALLINSDDDPACFVEDDSRGRKVICEECREITFLEEWKMDEANR